jgi:hypothetical protein
MITDYASLQSELQSWLWNRSDVVARIPVFIQLCEAQMNRRLQSRLSIVRTSITIFGETLAVPADFAGPISILLQIDPLTELGFVTPDGLNLRQNGAGASDSANPDSYTVEGATFRFYPIPGASVGALLTYRQKIPALSNTNTSNWILANHPDAYLYGALMQSAPWLRDDPRVALWQQAFGQILEDIQTNSDTVESLGTNLTPQPGYPAI